MTPFTFSPSSSSPSGSYDSAKTDLRRLNRLARDSVFHVKKQKQKQESTRRGIMNNKLTLITDSTLGKRRDNIFDSIQISNRTRCKEYPQRLLSTQQERKSLLFFSLFFAPFEGPIIHYFRPAGCWFFDVFFFLRTDDSVKLTAFVNCVVVVLFSSLIRDDRYTPPKREKVPFVWVTARPDRFFFLFVL